MDAGAQMSNKERNANFINTLLNFLSKWGTILTILALIVFFSIVMPPFLKPSNLLTILRSISIVTVIATGVTISLTVNGFDLSVGSVATFSDSLVISAFVWYQFGLVPAILVALGVCLLVGLANALLVVKLRIPDLLATLSMMFIIEGVAMTYTGGGSISEGMPRLDGTETFGRLDPFFKSIGSAPLIIIIMLVVVAVVHIFLNYTKHGRYLYVVGGNLEAARLSGIPVDRYRILAYLLSAFLAALGGVVLGSRIGSAQINAGAGYLMPAVAAAYIGFSVGGAGRANAIGTLMGAVLMGILENGLVMMSVPYYSLNIVKGAVLAIALASTYFRKR